MIVCDKCKTRLGCIHYCIDLRGNKINLCDSCYFKFLEMQDRMLNKVSDNLYKWINGPKS